MKYRLKRRKPVKIPVVRQKVSKCGKRKIRSSLPVKIRSVDLTVCKEISPFFYRTLGWCHHCRKDVPLLWLAEVEYSLPPETWFKCGCCLKSDLFLYYLSENDAVLKNQQAKEDNNVF